MPLDDYRLIISARSKPTLDDFNICANRYGVSLTAAVLRWMRYTERRAILVNSVEGYIKWAWSSEPAYKSGVFIKTANVPPVAVPPKSLAAQNTQYLKTTQLAEHDTGVWFSEKCQEIALASDKFDFTISLIHLDEKVKNFNFGEAIEEDTYEQMRNRF